MPTLKRLNILLEVDVVEHRQVLSFDVLDEELLHGLLLAGHHLLGELLLDVGHLLQEVVVMGLPLDDQVGQSLELKSGALGVARAADCTVL